MTRPEGPLFRVNENTVSNVEGRKRGGRVQTTTRRAEIQGQKPPELLATDSVQAVRLPT